MKFSSNVYEISHNDSTDIIRTHNYGYFEFWGKKCGFWIKIISSLKTETTVMGTENILWKFELNRIIFSYFIGIWSFKHKEIRLGGANLFWGVYIFKMWEQLLTFYGDINMVN